jgi:branched-chain amino acid transport system ATP-binding protein
MLSVENVSAGYGKLQVLNNVSMVAKEKEVTVIVGPNGSGKSTLLKTISGLTTIYSGVIRLDNVIISKMPAHQVARHGLAYLPQTESVFSHLTVAENLRMAGYTVPKNLFEERVSKAIEMFPQLSKYMDTKVGNLSGGERQMVAMSMALIRNPKVIMFDEPTANLSPKLASSVLQTVKTLASNLGLTVVLVEQNAKKALEIGDRAYLLVGGQKVFEGKADELLNHKELSKLYLGLKAV